MLFTLCLIQQSSKVLLGRKKRGFGAGRWNGFGGKVEPGESIEEGVRREVMEEIGVDVHILEKMGVLRFSFRDGSESAEVHVFQCDRFTGDIRESDEMEPKWFFQDALPYDEMWSADRYWMPLLFAGKHFEGEFLYDQPTTKDAESVILRKSVNVVS